MLIIPEKEPSRAVFRPSMRGDVRLVDTDPLVSRGHFPKPGLVMAGHVGGGLSDEDENGPVTASILSWDFGQFLSDFRVKVLPECTG